MPKKRRPMHLIQNRVVKLFSHAIYSDDLGFRYLGDENQRENIRCINQKLLTGRASLTQLENADV